MVLEMNKEVMFVKKRSAILWQWKLPDGTEGYTEMKKAAAKEGTDFGRAHHREREVCS